MLFTCWRVRKKGRLFMCASADCQTRLTARTSAGSFLKNRAKWTPKTEALRTGLAHLRCTFTSSTSKPCLNLWKMAEVRQQPLPEPDRFEIILHLRSVLIG